MTTIDRLVDNIFSDYDKNRNGRIELRNYYGDRDESFRDEKSVKSGYYQDVITVTRHSNAELFYNADQNRDGEVSRYELRRYVENYDINYNGVIDRKDPYGNVYAPSENDRFRRENRETETVISRDIINNYPRPVYPPLPPVYPPFPPAPPVYPNHPHHPHKPNHPHHHKKNEVNFKFEIGF